MSNTKTGRRVGRYRLVSELGRGGMGVVYRAYDPHLDRNVALKLLFGGTERSSHLLREAQAMAKLSGPSVLQVYDAGIVAGQAYIAMELIEGENLFRWLKTGRPWSQVLDAFVAAGRGLAVAHAAGVVHRDFKPGNVLMSTNGRVLVGDFGLAQSHGTSGPASKNPDDNPTRTETLGGAGQGTPRYMAPEQRDCEFVDARADQYSFCIAFVEAMSRAKAPSHIVDVAGKGLAIAPEGRFASMQELLSALETARATVLAPPPRPAISNRMAVAAALSVVGGVFLIGFASGSPASATPRTPAVDTAHAPPSIQLRASALPPSPERTAPPLDKKEPVAVKQPKPPTQTPAFAAEIAPVAAVNFAAQDSKRPRKRNKGKTRKRDRAPSLVSAPVAVDPPKAKPSRDQDPDGIIRDLWGSN